MNKVFAIAEKSLLSKEFVCTEILYKNIEFVAKTNKWIGRFVLEEEVSVGDFMAVRWCGDSVLFFEIMREMTTKESRLYTNDV